MRGILPVRLLALYGIPGKANQLWKKIFDALVAYESICGMLACRGLSAVPVKAARLRVARVQSQRKTNTLWRCECRPGETSQLSSC